MPFFDPTDKRGLFPSWLKEAPFASYQLPDIASSMKALVSLQGIEWNNGQTYRNSEYDILSKLKQYKFWSNLALASQGKDWSKIANDPSRLLHHGFEVPHDDVHGACGGWMSSTLTAAFDPLFWFHHCNVDRWFSEWQQKQNATTLEQMNALVGKNGMIPWNETILGHALSDMFNWDIVYEQAAMKLRTIPGVSSIRCEPTFSGLVEFDVLPIYSIMLKNVDIVNMPGSFIWNVYYGTKCLPIFVFHNGEDAAAPKRSFARILPHDFEPNARIRIECNNLSGQVLTNIGNPYVNIRCMIQQHRD